MTTTTIMAASMTPMKSKTGAGQLVLADDPGVPDAEPGDHEDEHGSDQHQEHGREPLPTWVAPRASVEMGPDVDDRDASDPTEAIDDQSGRSRLSCASSSRNRS